MHNHYDVLGVARDATELEIKNAYRVRAKAFHPDICTAPDAEIRFKEIQDAYMVLSDRRKRMEYDAHLMSEEVSGRPADQFDMVLSRYGLGSAQKKKKKSGGGGRKKKTKKANVFIDEIPDGVQPDDSFGGIL